MVTEQQKYIGNEDGGIDKAVFRYTRFSGDEFVTYGRSGQKFYYTITSDSVNIATEDGSSIGFSASVEDGVLSAFVDNTIGPGEKHPDLHPTKLIKHTIAYFKDRGHEITTFEGHWVATDTPGDSVNWEEFAEQYDASDRSDEAAIAAARNTWTGRLAAELGFTEVNSVFVEPLADGIEALYPYDDVIVRFEKPKVTEKEEPEPVDVAIAYFTDIADQDVPDSTILEQYGLGHRADTGEHPVQPSVPIQEIDI